MYILCKLRLIAILLVNPHDKFYWVNLNKIKKISFQIYTNFFKLQSQIPVNSDTCELQAIHFSTMRRDKTGSKIKHTSAKFYQCISGEH